MSDTFAIELKGVTKVFGQIVANKDVNLQVKKGEILAILGENGSGKTTLMNMLSGIYFPDEGQIYVNGEEVVIKSPRDAFKYGIGMVHQHFKLVDVFTATENIVLGINDKEKFNIKKAEKKVKEITDKYGFDINLESKVYEMSVSEKQTVEIVKVLYRGAQTLILDEPTVGLDPKQIIEIRTLIKQLGEDHTVLISSHILSEIGAVCDHVVIINKGHLVVSDSTENLEKLFKGQDILCLSAQGELEKIQNILREFPALSIADMKEAEEAETYRFQLKVQDQADYRKQLFFRFAEAGIPLLEISRAGMSLEDIFLEITEEGRA